MKFNYKARTKEGELQIGNVEAGGKEAATNILLSHGLFVLSIEPLVENLWYDRILDFFKRVQANDVMIFTRQFATLLSSQVPLADSLSNLYRQTTSQVLKETIIEISKDIESGFSLSQSLGRHPTVFSEFYVNMVKSAEATGRLAEVLDFLADSLEKQAALIAKVKNALFYPAFVIVLFLAVVIIMVTFVLPQIEPIFKDSKIELPAMTKILMSVGGFITNWWWAALIALTVFFFVLIDYFQTKEGKAVMNDLVLRLPIVGSMFQKLYISRFAESMRVLIKGGLTIPQSIEISSRTIGNVVYMDILHNIAMQIRKGNLLSKTIAATPEFPPLVSQLIGVGEQTGRLEELLGKINAFYTREVEDMVNNLVTLVNFFVFIFLFI